VDFELIFISVYFMKLMIEFSGVGLGSGEGVYLQKRPGPQRKGGPKTRCFLVFFLLILVFSGEY